MSTEFKILFLIIPTVIIYLNYILIDKRLTCIRAYYTNNIVTSKKNVCVNVCSNDE